LSDLLVIEFASEEKAEGVRELLLAMEKEYLVELGAAVVAVKDAAGRLKLNQLFQPVAHGTVPAKVLGFADRPAVHAAVGRPCDRRCFLGAPRLPSGLTPSLGAHD